MTSKDPLSASKLKNVNMEKDPFATLSIVNRNRCKTKANPPVLSHNHDIDAHYKSMHASLLRARDITDLVPRITEWVTDIGFTDYVFVRLERRWHINSQSGLLFSLPNELMRVYHEQSLFKTDLLLSYGKDNTQPIFGSHIYGYIDSAPFDTQLTNSNRHLIQLYRRYGYLEHCAIPMPAYNGNGHVMLILTSRGVDPEKFAARITAIMPCCRALCKAIDSVTSKKFRFAFIDKSDGPIDLPHKPLDALRRLAREDKSITDIAADMCISPITAHQHIATARKLLGVKTNVAAIIKAIREGLIDINT